MRWPERPAGSGRIASDERLGERVSIPDNPDGLIGQQSAGYETARNMGIGTGWTAYRPSILGARSVGYSNGDNRALQIVMLYHIHNTLPGDIIWISAG